MEKLGIILDSIDGAIYTYFLMYLLIASGIYFTVKCRFVQIRLIPAGLKAMLESPRDKSNMSVPVNFGGCKQGNIAGNTVVSDGL